MARPFEAWSARARNLARPFAENPFRLLELAPGASAREAQLAAREIAKRLREGRDQPHMVATGLPTRTVEQVEAAARALEEPAAAARHALFVPWLQRLTVDGEAVPAGLEAVAKELKRLVRPVDVVAPLAHLVLPGAAELEEEAEAVEEVHGGRLFPGDVDLASALGPPPRPPASAAAAPEEEKGFLAVMGKAPAAVADALLAATRLGKGRRLHASYLRALLAAADGGEPSALRRLPGAKSLFDELDEEPSAPLVLGWRDFVEGRAAQAKKRLAAASRNRALTEAERTRAQVLLARMALARGDDPDLEGLEGPEADAVRGAVALARGEVEAARRALDGAWEVAEARPRLAPLLALTLLAQDEVEAAARILERTPDNGSVESKHARAWLAHAQGELDEALEGYHQVLEARPEHLGASWGVAVLALERDERAMARAALATAAEDDADLAAELLELALHDGALDEVEAGLERIGEDEETRELRVRALDRLGRRTEAWALRDEHEDAVRDEARRALESGDPQTALEHLAGISLADPLRRRAARGAVLEALAAEPEAEPDAIVERVLGRVTPEEMALLDLPAHLYRAVRELEAGQGKEALASLRRHLDGGDDPLASRLFDILAAPAGDGWHAVTRFLEALLGLEPGGGTDALIDAASEGLDVVWEAAVITAAVQSAAADVGLFEGGSDALALAAGLLGLRHGLLAGDWAACADALQRVRAALPRGIEAVDRAEQAIAHARYPELLTRDPELALQAMEAASDDPAARAHDIALLKHFLAIGAEEKLTPESLAAVVSAWSAARAAHGWAHPALHIDDAALEDELLSALSALLGTIGPDQAEAARAALEKLDDGLARAALERAGWVKSGRGPKRRGA